MTGAVPAAAPAATAAPGNATILSASGEPPAEAPETPTPGTPPEPTPAEPGPETDPAEPAKEGEGDAEPEGVPESYDFKAPEGITLDPAAVEAFAPVAKDLGLSQSQAQRVVDLYAGLQQSQAEAQAAQAQEWAKQVTTDKEIGGAKWAQNQALIAQARDQFASPELVQLMEQTGLGNHPEVIKMFVRIGKQIADDGHVTGSGHATQPTDYATEYFAQMPKKERVS
jgi:hypothetical protein